MTFLGDGLVTGTLAQSKYMMEIKAGLQEEPIDVMLDGKTQARLGIVTQFLHPVGQSTLKYGVTIPIEAQTEQMRAIVKGEKVPVTIAFASGDQVEAEIRRLNNSVGQLQFRYEQRSQARLRQFLLDTFHRPSDGDLLEIIEYEPYSFKFRPIRKQTSPRLQIGEMVCHGIDRQNIEVSTEIVDMRAGLSSIEYDAVMSQADYNKRINGNLVTRGWRCEQKVVEQLGLRCDFEKNGVWLEIEFGNARSYYQDYIKFMLAKKYRDANLGVLLCPTVSFASLLCELGRQRAMKNSVTERNPVYSGMMTYEKAVRELPYLGFMLDMALVVGGIGISADFPEDQAKLII
ncbi:MAG: hypothetical protein LLG97_01485 [Deltaproteobacteria bacterium]|nr:hypothetical protein [Deltaproteobacteria bacterium]